MINENVLNISSDEVNCLIQSYLIDSGFQHTAFCLRQEARLDVSPNAKVHIPRGGLIMLLQKALLYIEAEMHWAQDKGNPCSSPFSLLSNHICSSSMSASPGGTPQGQRNGSKDKRRTSPKSANRQKRARLENQENKEKESTPALGSRGAPQSTGTPNKKKTPAKAKPAKPPAVIMLKGHSQEVFVVAWNPKIPNLLATGGKDSTLRLWNVPEEGSEAVYPTRICMHLPAGPACDITTISWNADGSLLATGAYDGIVRVWTFRGELFCVMTQHQGPIFSVKWSKTGYLLTGSLDETAIVWDVEAGGKPKQRFSHHNDGCLDVEWLEGEFFATCGSDRNIFLECIGENIPIAKLQGHDDEINQLKYEAKYKLLASGSDDYTACIWKVDDIAQYLADSADGVVKPRPDVRTFTHKLRGHEGEVANIQWQPKGDRETYDPVLVTSSFDGTVRMWNGHTGDCISIFQAGSGKVCGHSFAPRPDILAIVAGNKLILAKVRCQLWMAIAISHSLFRTAKSSSAGLIKNLFSRQHGEWMVKQLLPQWKTAWLQWFGCPVSAYPAKRMGRIQPDSPIYTHWDKLLICLPCSLNSCVIVSRHTTHVQLVYLVRPNNKSIHAFLLN
ncbi:transducin (beta)-like protein [Rhizoctonia solani AG-3 Rhs1AP]|uniref:Transducin (Beta)-like protein n=1 Tax=Rhizoctonia solani AG-3 Rhs1AP TaxID=1086054 RepID=X8JJK3_9AGAM|nr:transducin (beta)-like protein [Rhizoctonia solani AG-3 Rhs1AP]